MAFLLDPPVKPQLARSASALPEGDGWAYEPKYDGFRAIVFSSGSERHVQSRNGKPLGRYFPELEPPEGEHVLDGEIVIDADTGGEDFALLSQRIHPAASRIERLARETPARFVAFDVLAIDGETWLERPFAERRERLAALVADAAALAPSVPTASEAERWLHDAEGVIAKQADAPYLPGERRGMVKVKRVRTIDAVVHGWRPGKEQGTLGSLILGLYEPGGKLREVGHTSGFRAAEKRELPARLAPYETGARGTGEPSRWTAGRDLEWVELRPELVVEVSFDHTSAGRIRHGAKLVRWREDKDPRECTVEQLQS